MTMQELFNESLEGKPKVETSVITTEQSVIVAVSLIKNDLNLVESDYFIKKLVKTIPALDKIIIQDHAISAIMKIPMQGQSNNTIDSICNLGCMANDVISLIIDNSSIPTRIAGIAKDCKPWFNSDKIDEKYQDL